MNADRCVIFIAIHVLREGSRTSKDQIPLWQMMAKVLQHSRYTTVEHATSDLGKSGIIWWLKTQTRTERGGNSDGISANVERRGIRALASRGMWLWGALPFNRLVAECAAWKSWLINGLMWQYGLLKSPRPIQFLVELIDCRNQTPGWRTPKWITHGN